jgi:hypothetical protein
MDGPGRQVVRGQGFTSRGRGPRSGGDPRSTPPPSAPSRDDKGGDLRSETAHCRGRNAAVCRRWIRSLRAPAVVEQQLWRRSRIRRGAALPTCAGAGRPEGEHMRRFSRRPVSSGFDANAGGAADSWPTPGRRDRPRAVRVGPPVRSHPCCGSFAPITAASRSQPRWRAGERGSSASPAAAAGASGASVYRGCPPAVARATTDRRLAGSGNPAAPTRAGGAARSLSTLHRPDAAGYRGPG